MSCWKLLGIEKTADTRAIKRAYAARLKVTKPDEDPQGFSELHAAYKTALQQAKYLVSSRDEKPEAIEDTIDYALQPGKERLLAEPAATASSDEQEEDEQTRILVDEILAHQAEVAETVEQTEENDIYFQELQAAWGELSEQTESLLEQVYRAHKVENWLFLENTPALFDIQFKSEFSSYLFEAILSLREKYPSDPSLPAGVIRYLDNIFRWSDRRDMLEDEFGYEEVESMLGAQPGMVPEVPFKWTCPKVHRGRMEYAGYYARMAATVIDIVICLFIQTLITKYSRKYGVDNIIASSSGPIAALILYAIITPIMEALPTQATPGKLLFGMKVVSPSGVRLNILHALGRVVIFLLSTAAFKITVWINMFIYDGRLLHDRGSYSIVIKR